VAADLILRFPAGLAGFENRRNFTLVTRPELDPLVLLQDADSEDLCFPATPVASIDPGYSLEVEPDDQALLGEASDILILAILSPAENGRWTANLLAPVVINLGTRTAVQAVRSDSRYSHIHPCS